MTDTPTLFTVLTPTYNRAGTLHRVYESLSRQTFRDFEWVVVDDGSTDNTHESILDWQARADFPIRYFWQNNRHKKTAFNRGVREARGELIVALDSDDEMPPDALATFKEAWDSIPPARRESYVAVTGLCARPDGSIVGDRYPQDVFDSTAVDVYFRYRIKGEKFGCMRTDILRKYPFPEDVAGFVPESLVWWAIARAGYLSRFINRVVRTYHDTPGGLSQGAVSVGNNAQGLYLLAWDVLQHHLEFFRYRPRGVPTAVQAYKLTNPMAKFMVAALWPLGYAMYRRDRRRGVA
jgi:glycosyltransferase involved in cell wall biosynthesis